MNKHTCFFCERNPLAGWREGYNLTQCARCGSEIVTDQSCDPMNDSMYVCYRCELELEGES